MALALPSGTVVLLVALLLHGGRHEGLCSGFELTGSFSIQASPVKGLLRPWTNYVHSLRMHGTQKIHAKPIASDAG